MAPAGRKRGKALTRQDWILAARKTLIKHGIANVKVEPLARLLKVTPGSFYWHFSNREALHEALLANWREANTSSFHRAVEGARPDPRNRYLAFVGVWVLENEFDPRYDRAVREWAQRSPKAARLLLEVDADRITLLKEIFEGFGYHKIQAEIRARVTYYHQVGYYALNVKESQQRRLQLSPYYSEILTGHDFIGELSPDELKSAFAGNHHFERSGD